MISARDIGKWFLFTKTILEGRNEDFKGNDRHHKDLKHHKDLDLYGSSFTYVHKGRSSGIVCINS